MQKRLTEACRLYLARLAWQGVCCQAFSPLLHTYGDYNMAYISHIIAIYKNTNTALV